MSKSIPIELKVNSKEAEANLENVVKSLQQINETLVDNQKESKEAFSGLKKEAQKSEKGISGLSKGVNKLKKGFTGFGLAIKAIGLGLVLKAFETFTEVLGQNQKVVDFGNTIFQTT